MRQNLGGSGGRAAVVVAALCVVAGLSGAASAAEPAPCGGIHLVDGRVVSGEPLTVERARDLTLSGCFAAISAALNAEPGVISVTVAARAVDKARADGSALVVAKQIASALVASGLPEHRVSAVAPLLRAGEKAGLYITYAVRRRGRTVGNVAAARGSVTSGPPEGEQAPIVRGARLAEGDWLRTGPDSVAVIVLEDRSRIRLGPNTEMRLKAILLTHEGTRRVRLELPSGHIESIVQPAGSGSHFEVISGTAVAGVRGTTFRVDASSGGASGAPTTRLETLEGLVGLDASSARVEVPKGKGTQAVAGQPPEPPRDLLAAPKVTGPYFGTISPKKRLAWDALSGAGRYRVEVARDAGFVDSYSAIETSGTDLDPAQLPAMGRWFWKVTAVDPDGFVGFASKTYAFDLAP
ncbi:MAG: FecR family protein [Myxococcota bacterium]